MMRNLLRSAVVGATGLLLALGAGPAWAAGTPSGTPSPGDIAEIRDLAGDQSTLDRLAATSFPDSPQVGPADAARNASTDASDPVPVYQPTADFVRGQSDTPAQLAYVAVPATTGSGSQATIWAHRTGDHWKVYNVASGTMEKRFAAQSGDGYLLHEPQVNAWYSVSGDTVTVLDGSVTKMDAGSTMSLHEYQAALHARYADKLPGSVYDRSGAAGGYGGDSAAPAAPAKVAASAEDSDAPVLPFLLAGGALVLVGVGVFAVPRLRNR